MFHCQAVRRALECTVIEQNVQWLAFTKPKSNSVQCCALDIGLHRLFSPSISLPVHQLPDAKNQ